MRHDPFAFLGSLIVFFIIATVLKPVIWPPDRDPTDPPGGRSGLMILTDHETGIEYLTTARGGITPRLLP